MLLAFCRPLDRCSCACLCASIGPAEHGNLLLIGCQEGQVNLRRLHAGVPQPILQNVDRMAAFEQLDGVIVPQMVEREGPKSCASFCACLVVAAMIRRKLEAIDI